MVRKVKRKVINHFGDWTHYPYSNWLYQNHITPPRNIDRDGDGIVDWEDCDPYDRNKQGIWKSIKNVVSQVGKSIPAGVNAIKKSVENTINKKGEEYIAKQNQVSVGSGGGVYDTRTRTYIDSSNQGYSVPGGKVPIGAKVITTIDPTPPNRIEQPGTQQYVSNLINQRNKLLQQTKMSSGGGSSRSVSVPQQANQTQEVIEQQMNQVRMMAGLDPNLISEMSISQISQLKRKELLERRQRAMERFNQLQREKRKVYN